MGVSNPESVDELYEKVMEEVGRVDILVNNAGFGIFEDFLTFDLGKAYDMFEVNILGMMVLTQKFAIDMAERDKVISLISPLWLEKWQLQNQRFILPRNLQSLASPTLLRLN